MRRAVNRHVPVGALGALLVAIPIGVRRYVAVPDSVQGLCLGAGIALMLFGLYAAGHGTERLRLWKQKLISIVSR